jgi:hypothetical protein
MIDDGGCGEIGGMKTGRGNRSTGRKPALQVLHINSFLHSLPYRTELSIGFCTITSALKVKIILRLTVSQLVNPGVEPHLGLMTRYLLLCDSYGLASYLAVLPPYFILCAL